MVLDASSHLYKRVCPPVGPSVCMSVTLLLKMHEIESFIEMIKKVYKVMNNIKTAL